MTKKFILLIITVLSSVFFINKAEAAILRLNLYYQNGEIVWDNDSPEKIQYLKDLYFVEPAGESNYEIVIQSFKGVIIQQFKTGLKPTICYDSINPETQKLSGGCEELEKGPTGVDVPYYPNIHLANIFDDSGKLVFSANLSAFATCNENNNCEPDLKENKENCPTDCPKTSWPIWLLPIVGVILVALILFFILRKKKKTNVYSS